MRLIAVLAVPVQGPGLLAAQAAVLGRLLGCMSHSVQLTILEVRAWGVCGWWVSGCVGNLFSNPHAPANWSFMLWVERR